MKYYIWTEGCQMNVADSQRVASALEHLGYNAAPIAEDADVVVMNTCVVRQAAEDKAYGRLTSLNKIKLHRPELVINLMGCMVGVKGNAKVAARFPYVDVFSPPSDPAPLVEYLLKRDGRELEAAEVAQRFAWQDEDLVLPVGERGNLVSAFIPIVYGCSHACTYCIIPYRRGVELQPPAGRNYRRGARSGGPGRQRDYAARSNCGPLRQGPTGLSRPERAAAPPVQCGRHRAAALPDLASQLDDRPAAGYGRRAAQGHAAHRGAHSGRL